MSPRAEDRLRKVKVKLSGANGDEAVLAEVVREAGELERELPGRTRSFLLDDPKGRAREVREQAVRTMNLLRRQGRLYRRPDEATPSETKRTRPDRKGAVPLYIDTHALLTLLAAREKGFSVREKRTVSSEWTSETTRSFGFKLGLAPLTLFDVGAEGSAGRSDGERSGQISEREVYQTEGSLLYQLLASLEDEIERLDGPSWSTIDQYEFVEVHTSLRPNPWVEYLTAQRRLVDIAEPLAALRQSGGLRWTRKRRSEPANRIAAYRAFLDTALSALEQGGPLPLVGEIHLNELGELGGGPAPQVVVPVFPECVRDPSLREVTRGVVVVIGKVREKLFLVPPSFGDAALTNPARGNGVIPLVPSAILGALSEGGLATVLAATEELSEEIRTLAGLMAGAVDDCPSIVRGPAIEVAPLAILASQVTRRDAASDRSDSEDDTDSEDDVYSVRAPAVAASAESGAAGETLPDGTAARPTRLVPPQQL